MRSFRYLLSDNICFFFPNVYVIEEYLLPHASKNREELVIDNVLVNKSAHENLTPKNKSSHSWTWRWYICQSQITPGSLHINYRWCTQSTSMDIIKFHLSLSHLDLTSWLLIAHRELFWLEWIAESSDKFYQWLNKYSVHRTEKCMVSWKSSRRLAYDMQGQKCQGPRKTLCIFTKGMPIICLLNWTVLASVVKL